jgi:hypothetical protein
VTATPDAEPSASPTPGQLLDARLLLDDQTFDALDDQHRRLVARVDGLEGVVNMLERLLLQSPVVPGVPSAAGQGSEPARPPGAQPEHDAGAGAE